MSEDFDAKANPLTLSLRNADHLIVKSEDGSFRCLTHQRPPAACATENSPGAVVWQNSLDGGAYVAMVVRLEPYHGLLTLMRGDKVILSKEVGISYDAPFGPDMLDVQEWEQLCIEAADRDYADRGQKPHT